jgi:hypothetical protein
MGLKFVVTIGLLKPEVFVTRAAWAVQVLRRIAAEIAPIGRRRVG